MEVNSMAVFLEGGKNAISYHRKSFDGKTGLLWL